MSGGGGGGGTTQVEPWDQAKPFLQSAMQEAMNLYGNGQGFNPYGSIDPTKRVENFTRTIGFNPGEASIYGLDPNALTHGAITGVNPLNDMQRTAQQRMVGLAGGNTTALAEEGARALQRASNAGDMSIGNLYDTASGGSLNGNPYLEQQYGAASRGLTDQFETEVLPALAAQFSGGAGAHGSPDHQYWAGKAAGDLTNTLGDMRATMYGQNYQAERDRQQQAQQYLIGTGQSAAGQLPGIDEMLYGRQIQNINLLGQAGDMDYDIANQLTGRAMGQYGEMQAEPWQRLNAFSDVIYGNPGSSMGSQTGPEMSGNRLGSAAGGALSGAATGSMFGPYGMAAGALIGGAGGYFGGG